MKKTIFLFAFLIVKLVLQFQLIDLSYDLHRDEFLHLDQGRHLAWGYLSVPPVTSWISFIIIHLGNSVFWVKFFPALFGALTLFIVWKAIEALGGNLFALVLGATGVLLSVLLRINILYQPNSLDILMWTLLYYSVLRYVLSEDPKWLYATGVCFAFGFLNKYNILFLLLGLLPAILLTPQRKVFINKHFWLAMSCAFLLILPNLIWQYNNNFPVFSHLEELTRTQLNNVSRSEFLKDQVIYFLGSIIVLIGALISFFTFPPFKKFQVFFWAYVFTTVIFLWFRAKGYYAIGLYPILLAFGAVYLEYLTAAGWKKYLRIALIAFVIVLFIPMARIAFPVFSPTEIAARAPRYKAFGLLRWEDGKDHQLPQDFADMLGWKELAHKTDSAMAFIGSPEETIVICDNYGEAGAVNYYSASKNINAVSFSADYVNWFPLDHPIKNIILIHEAGNTEAIEKVGPLFATHGPFAEIENPFAREKGTTVYLFRDAKVDVNEMLRKRLSAARAAGG